MRSFAHSLVGLLTVVLCLGTAGARAQDSSTPSYEDEWETPGAADAGVQPRELDVTRTDAGFQVGGARASDAGTEAPAANTLIPPELAHDSPAPYPPELAREGTAGEVKLELLVDDEGAVAEAKVLSSSDPRFDASALHAATKLQFEPARLGGTATAVRIYFTYRFEAPKGSPATPSASAAPAPATIHGQVRTRGSRAPIIGATIALDDGTTLETDAEGRFSLSHAAGTLTLKVSARAHEPKTFTETLKPGDTLSVIYSLMPTTIDPYQTIVRSERERTEVSRVSLEQAEIHDVPGTMGDPFRVVMLLPGVSAMASGVAYPVVRGSQPASTGYYLDGIRVPILFHLFLGPAVVHPGFIDGIDFYPGVAPPEYGRLLGGAIDGRIAKAHDDRLHLSAYADVINSGALIEYPIEQTGTSITLAGRLSYTPWLLALGANLLLRDAIGTFVLDFWDYQGRIEQKLGGGRKLRLLVFGSNDSFGIRDTAADKATAVESILFHRADLRYTQPLGRGEVSAGITWGLDRSDTLSSNKDSSFELNVGETDYVAYGRYELQLDDTTKILAGADVTQQRAGISIHSRQPIEPGSTRTVETDIDQPVAIATYEGAWAQVVWTKEPGWTLIPGLRIDNYHLAGGQNQLAVEPRVTALKPLSDTVTLKAGAGLFHQAPTFLISVPVIDVAALRYGIQEALQLDAGVEWKLNRAFTLNVDAYANPMFRTFELNILDLPPQPPRAPVRDGEGTPLTGLGALDVASNGYAYGVEVMLRHPLGDNWFGWLSYSFQHSVRYAAVQRYDALGHPTVVGHEEVDFAFDQTHVLNAVLSYRFGGGWTVGGVVHFNTGRPELGEQQRITITDPFSDLSYDQWIPVERQSLDRLPPFLRIDARVAKTFAFEDFTLEAYLDVLNVSASQEVLGYSYPYDSTKEPPTAVARQPIQLPIILPILGARATY